MTKIKHQSPKFNVVDAADGDAYVEALAAVRPDLLAIPREEVAKPDENVAALLNDVLASVAASRRSANAEEAARLGRLEVLALALARAQHEFVWQSPSKAVANYDALVRKAERAFLAVEALFDQQVRRGVIRRREVPPRKGAKLHDRCRRIGQLIDILRDHRVISTGPFLDVAQDLSCFLLSARPATPGAVALTELRDRAYTALTRAFDRASPTHREHASTDDSGVFAIADLGLAVARAS